VVDGSLRKSGSTLRVAARLVRADNGFVVWSETYDRQSDDALRVQDDVAKGIAKALEASIDGRVTR
jgi:TolB-like protein